MTILRCCRQRASYLLRFLKTFARAVVNRLGDNGSFLTRLSMGNNDPVGSLLYLLLLSYNSSRLRVTVKIRRPNEPRLPVRDHASHNRPQDPRRKCKSLTDPPAPMEGDILEGFPPRKKRVQLRGCAKYPANPKRRYDRYNTTKVIVATYIYKENI